MDKIPSTDQSSDKLHILDYWRIIRVRFVTILLVFLLTAVTTTVVTFLLPKTYMSLSRISIEKDTSRSEERRVGKECRSRWSP